MGIDFAIDELYAAGWSALDTTECEYHDDGRAFPTIERVRKEFVARGSTLETRHVQLFDCYRAEWIAPIDGGPDAAAGAVVGHTESEAAVYALSQFLRSAAAAPAGSR